MSPMTIFCCLFWWMPILVPVQSRQWSHQSGSSLTQPLLSPQKVIININNKHRRGPFGWSWTQNVMIESSDCRRKIVSFFIFKKKWLKVISYTGGQILWLNITALFRNWNVCSRTVNGISLSWSFSVFKMARGCSFFHRGLKKNEEGDGETKRR